MRLWQAMAAAMLAVCLGSPAGAADAPRKVIIAAGTQVLNSSYPYLMMPQALGYWRDEGLDVEVVPAGGSSQAIQQMIGKTADFVEINSSSFLQALSKGTPLRAVMANTTVDWSLVVPSASGIKTLADFKGRTIGVSNLGSGGIPLLKAYLRSGGLDPDKDVSIQPVGFGAMALQAMNSGRVDGLMYWASAVASFESAGASLRYFRAPQWSRYADFSLVTLEGTLKDRPEVVEAILRGMAKASYFTVTNPECARKRFWQHYPELRGPGADDAAKARFDLKQIEVGAASMKEARALGDGKDWATAPADAYDRMQQFMVDNKVIPQAAPASTLVPESKTLYQRANAFDHDKIRRSALACGADAS